MKTPIDYSTADFIVKAGASGWDIWLGELHPFSGMRFSDQASAETAARGLNDARRMGKSEVQSALRSIIGLPGLD